jgi:hypothetical protein
MNENEKPPIEELKDELELWQTFCEVYRKKGVDISRLHSEIASKLEQGLAQEVRAEFRELCDADCLPEALAFLLEGLRHSSSLEKSWIEKVGHPGNREKKQKLLENAARTLDTAFGLSTGDRAEGGLALNGVPASETVSQLRKYSQFVGFPQTLTKATETRSDRTAPPLPGKSR